MGAVVNLATSEAGDFRALPSRERLLGTDALPRVGLPAAWLRQAGACGLSPSCQGKGFN